MEQLVRFLSYEVVVITVSVLIIQTVHVQRTVRVTCHSETKV